MKLQSTPKFKALGEKEKPAKRIVKDQTVH